MRRSPRAPCKLDDGGKNKCLKEEIGCVVNDASIDPDEREKHDAAGNADENDEQHHLGCHYGKQRSPAQLGQNLGHQKHGKSNDNPNGSNKDHLVVRDQVERRLNKIPNSHHDEAICENAQAHARKRRSFGIRGPRARTDGRRGRREHLQRESRHRRKRHLANKPHLHRRRHYDYAEKRLQQKRHAHQKQGRAIGFKCHGKKHMRPKEAPERRQSAAGPPNTPNPREQHRTSLDPPQRACHPKNPKAPAPPLIARTASVFPQQQPAETARRQQTRGWPRRRTRRTLASL